MSRRAALGSALPLCLVLAAWWLRLPEGPAAGALNVDVNVYFYPLWEATYARLAAGALPTWNPWQLCGIPWLATLQAGTFYPPHVVYLLLPLHHGLAVSNVLHLGLATAATAAFARRAGLSVAAGVAAGLCVGMRGMLAQSLAAPAYLEAAAWLPVGALAVLQLGAGRLAVGGALLATATAMSFLAGYPQPTTYMLLVWAALLVATAVAHGRWIAPGAAFAGAVAMGMAAAGIQLLPGLELVRDGAHRDLTPEAMAPFGMSPAAALLAGASIAGSAFAWGVTALALVPAALAGGRVRVLAWWAVATAALAALVALGDRTPLYEVYRRLPLLGSFRFPDRLLGTMDFLLAIAVAIGVDTIGAAARRRRVAAVVVAALAALVGAALAGGAPAAQRGRVVAFAVVAAALAIGAALGPPRRARLGAAGLVAALGLELLVQPWTHLVAYDGDVVTRYERHAPAYRALAARAGADRVWLFGWLANLQPEHAAKLATRYGVRAIDDYEPLVPRRQAEYLTYFSEGDVAFHRPPWLFAGEIPSLVPPDGVAPAATRRRLLDLAATRFVVLPATLPGARPEVGAFLRGAGLEPRPFESAALALYENPHVLPRAYVVHRTRPAPETTALLAALARPEFDPLVESFVEGEAPAAAPDAPRGAPARIVADGERTVEIEATLERPGLVVLADAFYPGWRATVDGVPAPIVATNHLFRGVPAPAGTHRVRFEYRPASVAVGAVASVAGWLGIAWLAWRGRRRRAPA